MRKLSGSLILISHKNANIIIVPTLKDRNNDIRVLFSVIAFYNSIFFCAYFWVYLRTSVVMSSD